MELFLKLFSHISGLCSFSTPNFTSVCVWRIFSRLCLCLQERDVLFFFPLFLHCWFIYEFGDLWLWSKACRRGGKRGKRGQNAACRPVRAHCSPHWDYHQNSKHQNTPRRREVKLAPLATSAWEMSNCHIYCVIPGAATVEISQFCRISVFLLHNVLSALKARVSEELVNSDSLLQWVSLLFVRLSTLKSCTSYSDAQGLR